VEFSNESWSDLLKAMRQVRHGNRGLPASDETLGSVGKFELGRGERPYCQSDPYPAASTTTESLDVLLHGTLPDITT
jgi:hypothetical protein